MTPLDLDEIARRLPTLVAPEGGFDDWVVIITPAERDALVAAARGIEAMRAQDGYVPPPARVPEMPADVAGTVRRLTEIRGRIGAMCRERRPPAMQIPAHPNDDDLFIVTAADDAATLIESLERQRQEVVAERDMWKATSAAHEGAAKRVAKETARAEQAEKELANERDKLNTARRCLADREELAQKDAARLAKLEAVVTAAQALDPKATISQVTGFGIVTIPYARVAALHDALAALDRKGA